LASAESNGQNPSISNSLIASASIPDSFTPIVSTYEFTLPHFSVSIYEFPARN
jgi:hypothetical protein